MKYKKSYTARGFELLNFCDDNGDLCDIQRSSSAMEDKIWLGTNSPEPKILKRGTGWIDYPLLDDVLINHRMHLTRKQCVSLALKLLKFGLFNKL